MDTRARLRWVVAALVLVALALVVGLVLGVLQEVVILLATVVACALSVLPVFVDRPAHPARPAGRALLRWRGRQEA